MSIAVRNDWHRTQSESGKSRGRNLPIPDPLFQALSELRQRTKFTGLDDFVLVSRAGTPINPKTLEARRLKHIGLRLQIPWLCWRVLRRTHRTLIYELGLQAAASELRTIDEGGLSERIQVAGGQPV